METLNEGGWGLTQITQDIDGFKSDIEDMRYLAKLVTLSKTSLQVCLQYEGKILTTPVVECLYRQNKSHQLLIP